MTESRISDPAGGVLLGLTDAQAAARLSLDGPNELTMMRRRSLVRVIFDVLREPMLLMLVAGGAIYLALGDKGEAAMLIVFAVFSVAVTIVQEARSERAIASLRNLASPRALVIRDGEQRRVAARNIVHGDLVVLNEGDRVPADGWVVANDGLLLDESLLTGESIPVSKSVAPQMGRELLPRPGGEGNASAFSGTLVVHGTGLCRIAATGLNTEMGRIGGSLALLETGSPKLYRETRRLVALFALGAVVATGLCVILYGMLRGSWLEAALAGIALGMSLLPEEFAVVLAIFLAMGTLRMSRVRVLARRAAAIETLGAATVLCTDKTGTLTENRMRVAELWLSDGSTYSPVGEGALPPAFSHLARLGVLASAAEPFDPMEVAFHDLDRRPHDAPEERGGLRDLKRHYPLDPTLLAVSRAWASRDDPDQHVIASKGAPEAIAELSGLDNAARAEVQRQVDIMARQGLRVLGVAEADWCGADLPSTHREFNFRFRGLVGLQDPLRASVPAAVRECAGAGIRVIMITGDYPETARAIALEAGIDARAVVTGKMLETMDDEALSGLLKDASVFARILPEQKLRIVQALKAQGEIVGMTGDGVNDAPSLKAADIGIAMGGRGTDVAREAASMVLLDDDFGSIVAAVRMGRRIYDNLSKAMGFIIAVHVPIAGLALVPLLFDLPILLGPVHMALLELIIDPTCSLAFEAEREERDIMRRSPRDVRARLLSINLIVRSGVQGAVALVILGLVLAVLVCQGASLAELRSTVFVALVLAVVALVLVNRSFSASLASAIIRPNAALAVIVLVVFSMLGLAELMPGMGQMLKFTMPDAPQALIALGAGTGILLILEIMKRAWPAYMDLAGRKRGESRDCPP